MSRDDFRHVACVRRLLCLALMVGALASCDVPRNPSQSSTSSTLVCPETPTTTHVAGGYTVHGKAAPGFFLYMYPSGQTRPIKAQTPEKFLLFMVPLPADLSAHVSLTGRHLESGRVATFDLQRHSSEFGTEWGTNFVFPAAGCWGLQLAREPSRGEVTIRIDK